MASLRAISIVPELDASGMAHLLVEVAIHEAPVAVSLEHRIEVAAVAVSRLQCLPFLVARGIACPIAPVQDLEGLGMMCENP